MLITVKMSTIIGILTFMSMINLMLSWAWKSKKCFQRKTMSFQPQFELASMLTAFYCVTMTHQLFQGRACTNIILAKPWNTKCCGYYEYKVKVIKNLTNSFLSPNNVSMQVWFWKPTGLKDSYQKRLNLQFFKDDDPEMRWPWKLGQGHPNHINSTFCHNDIIHYV